MPTVTQAAQAAPEAQIPLSGHGPDTLTLESSERLSSGMSLHTFSTNRLCLDAYHVSGQIDLFFHEDLDPTKRSHSLAEADRQLTFTPCQVQNDEVQNRQNVQILARNGRVAQLLGLPRLHGPLRADAVSGNGGFPLNILQNLEGAICIASGTGIAPFLALGSSELETKGAHLLYTINGNDFRALEYLLDSGLLVPENWSSVNVFVTAGDEAFGLLGGKGARWWQDHFATLRNETQGNLVMTCGRMSKEHVLSSPQNKTTHVLFCGNKSLEWQVKMWFLNQAPVYTTSVI